MKKKNVKLSERKNKSALEYKWGQTSWQIIKVINKGNNKPKWLLIIDNILRDVFCKSKINKWTKTKRICKPVLCDWLTD